MRYIEEEILKRKLKNLTPDEEAPKEITWKVRADSITWKEFVLEQVISFLLDSGGDVGLSVSDIAGEINIPVVEVIPVIDQLILEQFIVNQDHWLLNDSGKTWYILNRNQPNVGEKEKVREVTFTPTKTKI